MSVTIEMKQDYAKAMIDHPAKVAVMADIQYDLFREFVASDDDRRRIEITAEMHALDLIHAKLAQIADKA